jgi:GNAT superfamily N-acetyltransferase
MVLATNTMNIGAGGMDSGLRRNDAVDVETRVQIRESTAADLEWIKGKLLSSWGSTRMAIRGELVECAGLPGLIAGDGEGLLQFRTLRPGTGEIVTLEAFAQWKGVGTALVEAYMTRAKAEGLREVVVVTTNDNVDALRFYQARGFVIREVRIDAMRDARRFKPEIPMTGAYGLPIRDEIELVRAT